MRMSTGFPNSLHPPLSLPIILFFVVILVVVFFLGFATNLAKAKAHYSSNEEFVCFTGWRIATTKTMFTKV